MSAKIFFSLCLWSLLVTSCAGAATSSAPTAIPLRKSGIIRVAFPTTPDTADVPSLMAHDLLRAEGYIVQATYFSNPDLAVAALAQGDMDIGNGSTRTHWAAIAKSAKIVTVMEQAANVWSLVTRPDLSSCADLNSRRIAVNSAGSISKALLDAYVKQYCPTILPKVLYISGSDIRSVALQAGEIDGSLLEVADVLRLEKQSPGRYRTLTNYATALPRLKTNGIYATRAFAAQHPEHLRDYLSAVLTVHRQIRENPQLLRDALVKHLSFDAKDAEEVADAYLSRQIWDPNGGMTLDDVQYSIDFFTRMENLSPGLQAVQVYDGTSLAQVLVEIGRK